MTGIFIASSAPNAGKSLLSFSLGILLQRCGHKVGYMKPIGNMPQKKDELQGDADALVIQELIGQNVPAEVLSPIMLPRSLHALGVAGDDAATCLKKVSTAYAQISKGKDFTIVAGCGAFPATGRFCGVDGLNLIRELDLQVILIERYSKKTIFDQLLFLRDLLGPALMGVILNAVPEAEMRDVENVLVPYLQKQGISIKGIIGREPGLSAMRAADVALGLEGYLVAGNTSSARMVNGYLIGTMQVDNFMIHLGKRTECAVIVGGDRPDLQIAALHAKNSCACIILTGNLSPCTLVRSKAEEMGVPLIVVREETQAVAKKMQNILASQKLRELKQIRLGISLVEQSLEPGFIDGFVNLLKVAPAICS